MVSSAPAKLLSNWGTNFTLALVEELCAMFGIIEAHLQTNSEADRQNQYYDRATSTVQLIVGDVVLMKLDAFQGKRKVKDRSSKAEYVVVHQVADYVPMYEVTDDSRNVKVTQCNRLFLVDPAKDDAMPLGRSESISDEGATQSALVELTPLEWRSEMPESEVDEVLIRHLTSHVPFGCIDGDPLTFVLSVTIVIELSLVVHGGCKSPAGRELK